MQWWIADRVLCTVEYLLLAVISSVSTITDIECSEFNGSLRINWSNTRPPCSLIVCNGWIKDTVTIANHIIYTYICT